MRRRFTINKTTSIDINKYMTIVALEDNFECRIPVSNQLEEGLVKPVFYSINGEKWIETTGITLSVNKGDTISVKSFGVINNGLLDSYFNIKNKYNLIGNIMSLIYADNTDGQLIADDNLAQLFCNTSVVEVSPNFLPATTLVSGCYSKMFKDCTSLTTAPELPATNLAQNCYSMMFSGCISLTKAPELPATTLTKECYWDMFSGCTNLNYIKMLATDISADYCLSNWVSGVASTGTFVKSKDATWDVTGSNGVPTGWTVITDGQESGGGSITFSVEDNDGLITEYVIPNQMTWEEFINSEYNVDLRSEQTGEYYKEFRTHTEDGVKYYVRYRGTIKHPEDEYMMHKGDWKYVYIDEYIEPIQYTNM